MVPAAGVDPAKGLLELRVNGAVRQSTDLGVVDLERAGDDRLSAQAGDLEAARETRSPICGLRPGT